MQDAFRPCQCPDCQATSAHPNQERHRELIRLFRQLDERQRRLFAARESNRIGYGGDRLLSLVIGMNVRTIRKGRRELAALSDEASHTPRVRSPGAGRPTVEKKRPN